MCCLKYKGKEVKGRELKLHRITADKKLRKVRWSPLSDTGQKSDSMFATKIRTALFYTILFTLFRTEFFLMQGHKQNKQTLIITNSVGLVH